RDRRAAADRGAAQQGARAGRPPDPPRAETLCRGEREEKTSRPGPAEAGRRNPLESWGLETGDWGLGTRLFQSPGPQVRRSPGPEVPSSPSPQVPKSRGPQGPSPDHRFRITRSPRSGSKSHAQFAMPHRIFRTPGVAAFLKFIDTSWFGRLDSIVTCTSIAAASARNTSRTGESHNENDTRGGSAALFSLGSGVTFSVPCIRSHEHSALSQTASMAVRSRTFVSVIVTGRMVPAPS